MEAGIGRSRQLLFVLGLVLLLRLPFLNQAIQGDEDTYLNEAKHALVDPWHPARTMYVWGGEEVDLRGHPHPPLNAWILAGLIKLVGSVKEVPFHLAYIVFSLMAAVAMWSLALRFSPQPMWATLLFLAVPAFVVNGNSLETDVPFLAFWMAAVALFCARRLAFAAAAMALAAMVAFQAIFLTPILGVYVWLYRRKDRVAWLTLATPLVVIVLWQTFERVTTGALPASVLGGYFVKYGLQAFEAKLSNALMIFIHSWFIMFPPLMLFAWRKRSEPFLLVWIVIFFCGAVAVFFAGSARYLLPMAAPIIILASHAPVRWLATGFAAQMTLSLGLAVMNYQHWDAYRQFATRIPEARRVWVNGELGIRHYLEEAGALPLRNRQQLRAGDIVVTSEMTRVREISSPTVPVAQIEIRPEIPLRLIGLESHSGYSTVSKGFWPFGISRGLIDRVRAEKVVERKIELTYLPMNATEAGDQIISGIYSLEENRYRWIARSAVVALKSPAQPMPLQADFDIPQPASARRISIFLDGHEVATKTYAGPGSYALTSAAPVTGSLVTIELDQTFFAPGDSRELGIVLKGVGFRQ